MPTTAGLVVFIVWPRLIVLVRDGNPNGHVPLGHRLYALNPKAAAGADGRFALGHRLRLRVKRGCRSVTVWQGSRSATSIQWQ